MVTSSYADISYGPVEVVNGQFLEKKTGERFYPVGFNYIDLRELESGVLWHDTFNPSRYDDAEVSAKLAEIAAAGFNTVRVFIDNQAGAGVVLTAADTALSPAYMQNVAAFLQQAYAHGIYVIIGTSFFPQANKYYALTQSEVNIKGMSQHFLSLGFIAAKKLYLRDFIQTLIELAPDRMADTVFAIDIQNESAYHLNTPPFTLTSGMVTPANGVTYDMATEKVKMADEMAVYWTNQMAEVIHQEALGILVDVNVFTYNAVGRSIGDFSLDGTLESPSWRDRYPFRPEALAGSEADLLDIHFYTANIGDLQDDLDSIEFSAVRNACNAAGKPMIVGEFGAFKNDLSLSEAVKWKRDEVDVFAAKGFQGCLYWTYDNDLQTRLWHGVDGNGEIIAALASGVKAHFPAPQTLAYDDFATYTTGAINGQQGAPIGFSGSWTSGGAIVDDDTKRVTQTGGNYRSYRNFYTMPLVSSGTIYIHVNLALAANNDYSALEFATTGGNGDNSIRLVGNAAGLYVDVTGTGGGSSQIVAANDGLNHTWLIGLNLDTGNGKVWIDVDGTTFDPQVGGEAFTVSTGFQLNAINLAAVDLGQPGNASVVADDIYIYTNGAPVASAQVVNVAENGSVDFVLTGSDPDNDPISFLLAVQPANGTLSGTAPNLTYAPDADFIGVDRMTFKVSDGLVSSRLAKVTINVNAPMVITNHSFEAQGLSTNGQTVYGAVSGWYIETPTAGVQTWASVLGNIADGTHTAVISGGGSISQTLTDSLAAGGYTLSAYLCDLGDYGGSQRDTTGDTMELWAGSTLLAAYVHDTTVNDIPDGEHAQVMLSCIIPEDHPDIAQPLKIRFSSVGSKMNVDQVTLIYGGEATAPCANYFESDFDQSCYVDLFDYSIVASEFGVDVSQSPFTADLDGDNDVDVDDLLFFASQWLAE